MDTPNLAKFILLLLAIALLGSTLNSCGKKDTNRNATRTSWILSQNSVRTHIDDVTTLWIPLYPMNEEV